MYARSALTLLVLLALSLAPQALAQGTEADEPDEGSDGGFTIGIGTWISQATGTGLHGATSRDVNNPFSTTVIEPEMGTQAELYYFMAYEMPNNYGKISARSYAHSYDDLAVGGSTPGEFNFGESLAHPLFAGVNLDGYADAFSATFEHKLKDFRLDYSRTAFDTARIRGDWFVGWRRVDLNRRTDANYSALVPGFPAFLPPLTSPKPQLDPEDDVVSMTSDYRGRGLEFGLDFEIPLVNNLMTLEAGFAIAALRGKVDVSYASTTHYYVLDELDGTRLLLGPPYSEFGETIVNPDDGTIVALADLSSQKAYRVGLQKTSESISSMVLETYLGLRWEIWKGLTAVTGFRQARYDDIALELRPEVTTTAGFGFDDDGDLIGINTQNYTEVKRSATYEGFYFGVAYTF